MREPVRWNGEWMCGRSLCPYPLYNTAQPTPALPISIDSRVWWAWQQQKRCRIAIVRGEFSMPSHSPCMSRRPVHMCLQKTCEKACMCLHLWFNVWFDILQQHIQTTCIDNCYAVVGKPLTPSHTHTHSMCCLHRESHTKGLKRDQNFLLEKEEGVIKWFPQETLLSVPLLSISICACMCPWIPQHS